MKKWVEKKTIAAILHLCLRKTSWLSWRHCFWKSSSFSKCFFPHENAKPAFSDSSDLQSIFEKLRFRDGLVWTPNQRNKAAFSDSSGVVWTPPERETNSHNNNVFNQFWRLHRNRFCWKVTIISWIIQLIKKRGRLTSLTKIKRATQRLSKNLWCPRFLTT